MLIENRTKATI